MGFYGCCSKSYAGMICALPSSGGLAEHVAMINDFKSLRYLILSDLYRYHGRISVGVFVRELILGVGFRYTFWLRLSGYFAHKSGIRLPLRLLAWLMRRRYIFKFGIAIPYDAPIGPGLYIGHFGSIILNANVRIGRDCTLMQDVTIGVANCGPHQGVPTIGDGVFLGPGAKIFGNIRIGNDAAIGANAVVNRDVPDHAVVVGAPARIVSYDGAAGYVHWTDYDRLIGPDPACGDERSTSDGV